MIKAVTGGKLVFPDGITEGNLLFENEKIIAAGDVMIPGCAEIIDAAGLYVGPGFIDQHVHGYHQHGEGYDITDNVREVASAHLRHGVTSVTPSPSYSLKKDRYLSIIAQCNEEIGRGDSSVAGIHLEGPYVNPRYGAGRKYAWKYSDEAFEGLFEAGGRNILHCTYAPEMPWAERVEDIIAGRGVVMDIGHTAARPEDIYRAVRKGAKIVTHLFDATGNYQGIHAADLTGDAQDSVSLTALSIPGLYYEIISDSRGVHVTHVSQRLAMRTAGEDHIILVSDCTYHRRADICPSEYAKPDYPEDDIRSAPDVNVNRDGKLFGSRLTVADCVKNFKKVCGIGVRESFKCASTNSAKALNIYDSVGSIHPGKLADIVMTDEDMNVKKVIFRGMEQREIRSFGS